MDDALKSALERLDEATARLETALAPRLVLLAAERGTRDDLARSLDTVIETLEQVLEATPPAHLPPSPPPSTSSASS